MTEIKPCPNPECRSEHVGVYEPTPPNVGVCGCYCDDCHMEGPSAETREQAIAAWNRLSDMAAAHDALRDRDFIAGAYFGWNAALDEESGERKIKALVENRRSRESKE